MHDACGSDDLVGRVAPEVEAHGGLGDFKVDGPNMQTSQHTLNTVVVEVQVQPTELDELGNLPQAR